jgi:preprotein translocase subunit Sec61beta
MKFNKDYMMIMRAGKNNLSYYDIKKQNNSGMVLGLCLLIAGIVLIIGIFIK